MLIIKLKARNILFLLDTKHPTIMAAYHIRDQHALYFLTITVVGWLDVFTRKEYKDIIINSLKFCMEKKDLHIYAFVIMSNHIHLIANSYENDLSDIIRDFKQFTAKSIINRIIQNVKESRSEWMLRLFKYYAKYNKNNLTFQFWQRNSHAVELVSPKWINQKINYIHMNPVNKGIVLKPEWYCYSSASNYLFGEGILDVEVIDIPDDARYF